jgi:ubiquinone/menaquinone biosynthesis C-methylase UbiE
MAILEDPERHEVAALARMVPSFAGLRVLEIGCGDGRLTRRYVAGAGSIIAIDPKAEAIAALHAALPEVDARAIGIDALDLPPHSVDVAIFSWSL